VCALTHAWPAEEKYELGSQARRSSNSSPANLAEKHSDRHVKNKIEGVNRARGEGLETVPHLYIARLKSYIPSGRSNANSTNPSIVGQHRPNLPAATRVVLPEP
jgi:four helix bundle protein